jgi:hypothetical protein
LDLREGKLQDRKKLGNENFCSFCSSSKISRAIESTMMSWPVRVFPFNFYLFRDDFICWDKIASNNTAINLKLALSKPPWRSVGQTCITHVRDAKCV